MSNIFKAKLVHFRSKEEVVFEATPDISESRSVDYQKIDPIHMPGSIMAYATTPSRTFGVSNIKLISQTRAQADVNMAKLQTLRSWCMPRFGKGMSYLSASEVPVKSVIASTAPGQSQEKAQAENDKRALAERDKFILDHNKTVKDDELLGAPPPILFFSAYSGSIAGGGSPQFMQNINRIPVVITSLDIPYPSDVDYIPNSKGVPFPTIMIISLSLTETHSPKTFSNFDLKKFKEGKLGGF
jgi:hypothetical protein